MTDERAGVSLEDVRARFLEAETQLEEASKSVSSIEAAAAALGDTRQSLAAAGDQISGLASRLGEVADALTENAHLLTAGVEAIRLGDPAAIRQEIQELDAAFSAFQSVIVDRLTLLEGTLATADAAAKAQQRERRLTTALLLVAIAVVAVLVVIL